jgi:hypothetical protein
LLAPRAAESRGSLFKLAIGRNLVNTMPTWLDFRCTLFPWEPMAESCRLLILDCGLWAVGSMLQWLLVTCLPIHKVAAKTMRILTLFLEFHHSN